MNRRRVNPFYHPGEHCILKMTTGCTLIAHIDSNVIKLARFLKEIQYWGLLSSACFSWCWKMKLNVCRSRLSIFLSSWRSFTEAASAAGFFSSSLHILLLHVCWIKVRAKSALFFSILLWPLRQFFLYYISWATIGSRVLFWVRPQFRSCLKYVSNSCYNSCSHWSDWETNIMPISMPLMWGEVKEGGGVRRSTPCDGQVGCCVAFSRAACRPLPPRPLTSNPD